MSNDEIIATCAKCRWKRPTIFRKVFYISKIILRVLWRLVIHKEGILEENRPESVVEKGIMDVVNLTTVYCRRHKLKVYCTFDQILCSDFSKLPQDLALKMKPKYLYQLDQFYSPTPSQELIEIASMAEYVTWKPIQAIETSKTLHAQKQTELSIQYDAENE